MMHDDPSWVTLNLACKWKELNEDGYVVVTCIWMTSTYIGQQFGYVNTGLCVQGQREIGAYSTHSFGQSHRYYDLILYVVIDATATLKWLPQIVCSSTSCFVAGFSARSKCRAAQNTVRGCFTAHSTCQNEREANRFEQNIFQFDVIRWTHMIPEQLSRPIVGNSLYASISTLLFRLTGLRLSLAPWTISSAICEDAKSNVNAENRPQQFIDNSNYTFIGSVPLTKLHPKYFFGSPASTRFIGSKWWTGFTVILQLPPPFGKYLSQKGWVMSEDTTSEPL